VTPEIQWPVLACLDGCGHFRAFPVDDVPELGVMMRCHECRTITTVLATVSVADLVRLFDEVAQVEARPFAKGERVYTAGGSGVETATALVVEDDGRDERVLVTVQHGCTEWVRAERLRRCRRGQQPAPYAERPGR
jgi:hypothetical protein